jgi:hypothetical protein
MDVFLRGDREQVSCVAYLNDGSSANIAGEKQPLPADYRARVLDQLGRRLGKVQKESKRVDAEVGGW